MKHIPISQVDVLFSSGIYPIEFAFFFGMGFKTQRLRAAMRTMSAPFWPLFGEYRDGHISSRLYREEDHYGEESLDQELDATSMAEGGYAAYSGLKQPALKSLFFMKVLRLRNGLMVIPKLSHLAGDGYSYFYVLSVMAALARSRRVPFAGMFIIRSFMPHHRRTALRDFVFRGSAPGPEPPGGDVTVEREVMSRREVQTLVEQAGRSAGRRISANDVLSAWAVKRLAGGSSGLRGEEIGLTIPIDVRRRVKEYGPRFFGNGIWLHTLQLRRGDIEEAPLADIAARVRASMPSLSTDTYRGYLKGIETMMSAGERNRLRPFDPSAGCLVTNLSKLPADKLDFGAGPPDAVLPLTTGRNSAAILADHENYFVHFAR